MFSWITSWWSTLSGWVAFFSVQHYVDGRNIPVDIIVQVDSHIEIPVDIVIQVDSHIEVILIAR